MNEYTKQGEPLENTNKIINKLGPLYRKDEWHHLETGHPDCWDALFSTTPIQLCLPLCFGFVYTFCVSVCVQWQLASHCPIIPAPLTLRILCKFPVNNAVQERRNENLKQM